MTKPHDDGLKKLLRARAHDFLPLVRPDLQVEELLPTALGRAHVHADGLLRCRDVRGRLRLVHFAFLYDKDAHRGERLLEYSLLASRQNDSLPVISCVIYLNDIQTIPRPPLVMRPPNGAVMTCFHYVCAQLG
ncbi:MAG TPA: hypothetical protein VGF67_06385 [Ktedonobacteraceae bacterium]